MVSLASDDMLGISFNRYMFDSDGNKRTTSEAKDLYLKEIKRQNNRNFENLRKNASGVQKEWLNENAGIIPMTMNFLIESAAVGISGGAAGRSAFFMYASNGIEDQMLSREFDGLTEWEKKPISVLYGFIIGQLEKIGFETSLGAFSNNTFGKISRFVIKDALKNVPKDASREVIETAIKNSLKAKIIDAGIRFTAGGFSEGSVEAIQSFAEVGIKEITNDIMNLEYFDTPALTTYEGMKEMLSEAAANFGYGAIGGHVFSAGGMAINGVRTGAINATNNKEFKDYYDVISDEQMLKNAKSMVLYRMQKGEIDKAQADAELDALDRSHSISNEIPTDLNTNQTRQAFDLLLEKMKIQEEIEGKQESLIKEQKDRLQDIDKQLELISKGGYKNAIQEQETDEKVLPDEGPEVGLQEVVEERQEQTTEEEALKSIQEENKVREKNNADLIPETEQEINKRKEELNEEKKALESKVRQ